jgi:hypothetical protein
MVAYSDIRERSIDELRQELLDIWDTLGITDPLHFGEGSQPGLILNAVSRLANQQSKINVISKAISVGEAAFGDALTAWSKSVYGHDRVPAQASQIRIRLTCAAGSGPHTFSAGDVVATDETSTFRLIAGYGAETLPSTLTAGTSKDYVFECEAPGILGNVSTIGAINRLVTTFIGVTCSNQSIVRSGGDEETDTALKERNRTVWATRNPLSLARDAVIYYARFAHNGVRRVQVLDDNPRGDFTFDVILASDSGAAAPEAVAAAASLLSGKMLAPFAARMLVRAASTLTLNPAGSIYYYAGFSADDVEAAVSSVLLNLQKELPIGGETFAGYGASRILRAQLEKAIESAKVGDQPAIKAAVLSSPAESTAAATDAVAVIDRVFDASHLNLIPVAA